MSACWHRAATSRPHALTPGLVDAEGGAGLVTAVSGMYVQRHGGIRCGARASPAGCGPQQHLGHLPPARRDARRFLPQPGQPLASSVAETPPFEPHRAEMEHRPAVGCCHAVDLLPGAGSPALTWVYAAPSRRCRRCAACADGPLPDSRLIRAGVGRRGRPATPPQPGPAAEAALRSVHDPRSPGRSRVRNVAQAHVAELPQLGDQRRASSWAAQLRRLVRHDLLRDPIQLDVAAARQRGEAVLDRLARAPVD